MENCTFHTFSPQDCKQYKRKILESFEYHEKRGDREKAILSQIISDAAKNNTKITYITDNTKELPGKLGLVALSLGVLEVNGKNLPALVIDYLFVDDRYRKTVYSHFSFKISQMLLTYAIQQAMLISQTAGVRYLILQPDGGKKHESLIDFYCSMRFRYMTDKHDWMYLKLN